MIQRYARFRVLSSVLVRQPEHPRLLVTGHRHVFAYEPREGFLYVRSRAISSRTNDNYDTFPAAEIKSAWRTFIGKPVFVNHANANPRRARGVVVDAALHEDVNPDGTPDVWVEALMEIDAVRFPKLAAAILSSEVDRTSMGANVEYSLCSFCGNRAETPMEYCAHVKTMKGQRITRQTAGGKKEAVLVSEVCYGLGFFENSLLVEQPADPTAHMLGVDARGLDAGARVVATASLRTGAQDAERYDEAAGDDHNSYALSGCHHTSCGRWLGHRVAERDDGTLEERLSRVHPPIEPVGLAVAGARDYSRQHGLADPHASGYADVRTSAGRIHRLADAYDHLPDDDPRAREAFKSMRDQVDRQYAHLTGSMGIRVEPVDHDPYASHREMAEDLTKNKRIKVLSTRATGGHPIFTPEENDRFRAVHDVFGHAATGRAFDAHGEEAAWLAHSQMFEGDARRAMSTETRGQNGSLIRNRRFAPQRVALLPDSMLGRDASLQTEAAPRHANPGDHPFFQANPVHSDHIVAHWDRATPEEREQGKRWYGDAHIVAKAIAHGDAHKGAGVLAAYSPQTAWPVNMFNAARSLHTGQALGGPGSGVFATGSMKGQAQRIIDGEHHQDVLKGPKIQDFAHLIEHGGDADPEHPRAVIDRHAMSVAAGKRFGSHDLEHAPLGNRHYYGHVVAAYHEAARRISASEGEPVEPHQVQATTWLVRQRENVQEDDANVENDQLDKGRRTRRGHDREDWDQWAGEHYPELRGPGYHSGSAHLGYGEQVAPPKVDTLRPEDCPICGDTETFDGDQCRVCGYVAPPDQFIDPNLELARQLDEEGDDGAQDPAADGLDDEEDDEPDDEEEDDPEEEDDEDQRPPIATAGGAHPEGRGVRMSTNQGASRNPAGEQRVRLLAAMRAQQNDINAQAQRLDAQERLGQQVVAQLGKVSGLLAVIAELAGLSEHPKAVALTATADGRGASFHAGRRQGALDHRTGSALDTEAKAGEWARADAAWKDGWTEGYEASRRTAAGDQRGEAVPTTNEQALAPAATDDPQSYGAAPAPANQGVTPAATTDVQSTDVAVPATPFNQLTDVTAPVPADISAPPPVQDSHVPQEVETLAAPDLQPAMTETGWTAASADSRFFAALNLARLRRTAGITRRDELVEAQAIVDDATATPQVVAAATQTLQQVLGARRAAPSPGRRDLVPTPASGERSMPSVAGREGVQPVAAPSGGVEHAEFLDLA